MISRMEITTTSLAHLGLVAGIFDKLDIADIIDSTIPKKSALFRNLVIAKFSIS